MGGTRVGLDGSDADETARAEERPRESAGRSRSKSITVTRNPAAELAAHSEALQNISAEARLSVGVADATLSSAYERFNSLSDRYVKALDTISQLRDELAEERRKDRDTIVIEAKTKQKKAKLKERGKTQRQALVQLAPLIHVLAQRAPAIISSYLPIGIDAANGDGNTPRAAMRRLLKRMFVESDELYTEYGVPTLALLKAMAAIGGDDDWAMIEQFLMGVISASEPSQDSLTH